MRNALIDLAVATLGRAPSLEELQAWEISIESGATLVTLAGGLLQNDEGQARLPAQEFPEAFLVQLYQALFDRLPDTAGMNYWLDELQSGAITLEGMVQTLLAGARAITGNPNDAALADARTQSGIEYLADVDTGEIEYDMGAASRAIGAITRESLADPALEPALEDFFIKVKNPNRNLRLSPSHSLNQNLLLSHSLNRNLLPSRHPNPHQSQNSNPPAVLPKMATCEELLSSWIRMAMESGMRESLRVSPIIWAASPCSAVKEAH